MTPTVPHSAAADFQLSSVSFFSPDAEIKRAYRRLARRFHPDINPGDRMAAQQFRRIAEAYDTLIDPDRRRQYDASGRLGETREPTTFGFEGFDFSVSVDGTSASTFGDLFGDVLRQRAGSGRAEDPQRGADQRELHACRMQSQRQ